MEAENKFYKNAREIKDVLIGICFLLIGFFFFLLMTFWIIISKIINISSSELDKLPKLIHFFVKDQHYAFVITLFLPVLIIMFYFRRIAFNYFRHSF